MIRLTTSTLVRLRDRLRERGARPSNPAPSTPPGSSDQRLAMELSDEYGPLCDAMYVVMGCDGEIAGAERDVIRGALREIDARIHSVHIEAMLAAASRRLGAEGRAGCIRAIGQALADDAVRAEAAFMLAAAVAYADDRVVQAEKDVLNALAGALGIAPPRAGELFDSLEQVDELSSAHGEDVDAGDLLLRVAMRLNAPEDFERLAATSARADVALLFRLFASFVRSGEEMRERAGMTPRSLSAARVAALHGFAEALSQAGSATASAMGATLSRLARALDVADKTTGLRPLITPPPLNPEEPSPMASLESALAGLARLAHAARPRSDAPPSMAARSLARVVETVVADVSQRSLLQPAIDASIRRAEQIVPVAIAEAIALVLQRIVDLPVERPSLMNLSSLTDPVLPEWLPSKRTLGGFYVLSQLGVGGTATVFLVTRSDERDEPQAERFALKVPIYDVAAARQISEAEYLRMFREEAGALLALPDHPNLCRFISFDAAARPKPVLVMELVEGNNCEKAVAARSLTVARVFSILDGVLAGLGAMHGSGIGHLDLKPSNVVLRASGEPTIVDFGLAGRHLRPGCGTVAYAAPEIWGVVPEGSVPSPLAADMYGFGCVAYELFTGRTLFDGNDEIALVSAHVAHDGRPEGIARLAAQPRLGHLAATLSHCLRRDPRDRPSVAAVRGALRNVSSSIAQLPWPLSSS